MKPKVYVDPSAAERIKDLTGFGKFLEGRVDALIQDGMRKPSQLYLDTLSYEDVVFEMTPTEDGEALQVRLP